MIAIPRKPRPGETVFGGKGAVLVDRGNSPSELPADATKEPDALPQDDLMLEAHRRLERALAKKFEGNEG